MKGRIHTDKPVRLAGAEVVCLRRVPVRATACEVCAQVGHVRQFACAAPDPDLRQRLHSHADHRHALCDSCGERLLDWPDADGHVPDVERAYFPRCPRTLTDDERVLFTLAGGDGA